MAVSFPSASVSFPSSPTPLSSLSGSEKTLLTTGMYNFESKPPRCGERSAYIAVMLGPMHCTPCHASSQGSPPVEAQPRRSGEPSETYSLFTASTASTKPEENRTYVTCIVLQGSTKFYQILLTVLLIGVGRCKEGDGEREHLGIRML
jgi:hypothetical protein